MQRLFAFTRKKRAHCFHSLYERSLICTLICSKKWFQPYNTVNKSTGCENDSRVQRQAWYVTLCDGCDGLYLVRWTNVSDHEKRHRRWEVIQLFRCDKLYWMLQRNVKVCRNRLKEPNENIFVDVVKWAWWDSIVWQKMRMKRSGEIWFCNSQERTVLCYAWSMWQILRKSRGVGVNTVLQG